MSGGRTIHVARRIAASWHPTLFTIVAGLTVAATPLAGQQIYDQRPAQRSAQQATSPIDSTSSVRTPIRRDNEPAANPTEVGGAGSLWGTFITLGLILGGLYLVLRVLKRFSPAAQAASQRAGLIDVIATRRIDAQSAVHLVRIGPRILAVGASPAGLTTLGTFDDPSEVDEMLDTATTGAARALFNGARPVRSGGSPASQPRQETTSVHASSSPQLVRGGPHG